MTPLLFPLRSLAALLLCVVLAACGSTVQVGAGGAGQPLAPGASELAGDDGMSLGGAGSDGLAPGAPGDTGGAAGGAGSGGQGAAGGAGTAGTSGAGTGPDAANPGAPGASGAPGGPGTAGGPAPAGGSGSSGSGQTGAGARGLTATTIKIGLEYASDSKEANAALGENVSSGDAKAACETLIDYYNRRGGFGGRKIEPVYFEYSAFQELGPQQQEACAYFTQDEPVYAVMLLDSAEPYVNCLAKAGTGAWGYEGLTATDDPMFARYPGFAMPSALSLTQVARLYGPGLRQAGFFEPEAVDKSTTVGLITFDEPSYRRAAAEFEKSLAGIGEQLDETRFVHYAQTLDQAGQLSTEVSSAVLRFSQEGVDHVTIIEENALVALSFQQAAERQGYRPQYGFNSTSGGQLFIDAGLSEANQMVNSRLVGWQPQFDVPSRYVGKWPAQQECLRMYERAGIATSGNAKANALLYCAGFSFMQAALKAAPEPLTIASIQAGTERLGTSWQSPWNKETRFGPGRHYGTARYLTASYEQGCNCFKPAGGMRPIP